MEKKAGKIGAIFEIFLVTSMSFAVAFLISEYVGVVGGEGAAAESIAANMPSGFGGGGSALAKQGAWQISGGALKIAGPEGFKSVGAGTYSFVSGENTITMTTDATGKILSSTTTTTAGTTGGNVVQGLQGGISDLFAGKLGGGIFGPILGGLAWGAIVGGIAWGVAKLFGLTDDQAVSVGLSAGVGTFVGTTTYFYLGTGYGLFSTVLGIGVGGAILVATYKEQKKELIRFECLPWEAPLGGNTCDECNNNPNMPCSEYRCKSLGQACEIVNKGTENELCVWVGKDDTQAPKIFLDKESLMPDNLGYYPEIAGPLPPKTGVKILREPEGCLPAFSNLKFGFRTDEPAQCKIGLEQGVNYDKMGCIAGSTNPCYVGQTNQFLLGHEQFLKAPDPFSQGEGDVPEIHNNGEYTLYVRCIDANGNGKDSAAVSFSFCVEPGPDTTPPNVSGFSIRSGQPVRVGIDNLPIEVYTNEPAECRWSRANKDFDAMENAMECSDSIYEFNSKLNYVCSGQLTAIKDRQDNEFYFRCKDYSKAPGGRNVMTESAKLVLKGTQELIITETSPDGEFTGATTTVPVTFKVETQFGADNGKSTCMLSPSNAEGSFFEMQPFNVRSVEHNMTLDLGGGNYTYYFRCIDDGGNVAEESTNFSVRVDTEAPRITRVFRDADSLKVITNEPAVCVYSTTSCNYDFDQALRDTPFTSQDVNEKSVHSAAWDNQKTYYVKCQDLQGNRPRSGTCQIVAQGGQF